MVRRLNLRTLAPSEGTFGPALRRRFLVLSVVIAALAAPASAAAYWDFQGLLCPGCAYGEGQSGTSGEWRIRLSRDHCDIKVHLRRRSDGGWQQALGPGCSVSDFTVIYDLASFDASNAKNLGSSDHWANVRIDATT